jgi:amino acid adenylation domain-containing protein
LDDENTPPAKPRVLVRHAQRGAANYGRVQAVATNMDASVVRVDRQPPPATSFVQERLWFLSQIEPDAITHHVTASYRLAGALDAAKVQAALQSVVRHNETLRTTFGEQNGVLVQVIAPPDAPVSFSSVSAPDEEGAFALVERALALPLDLANGPLFRSHLVAISPTDHILVLTAHLAICDDASMRLIAADLEAAYSEPGHALPPRALDYADFAVWQRSIAESAAALAHVAFWKEHLDGAPAALDVPTDRPRPMTPSRNGGFARVDIPSATTRRLVELAKAGDTSLRTIVVAGLAALFARLSGADEIVLGNPTQVRRGFERNGIVGSFTNMLPLRVNVEGKPTFTELVRRTNAAQASLAAHGDVPFEVLVDKLQPARDLTRTPFFQCVVATEATAKAKLALGAVTGTLIPRSKHSAPFDLSLTLAEPASDGGTLGLSLVYATDLFEADRAEAMLEQLALLLDQATTSPNVPVGKLSLVTNSARGVLPDPEATLDATFLGAFHEVFAKVAARSPDLLALADPRRRLTYGELDERANRLAHKLLSLGIAKGDRVAIFAHRSSTLVLALLGVVKSGGAFVLLDPSYPADRLAVMLEVAQPRVFIRLADGPAPPAELEPALEALSLAARLDVSSDDVSQFASMPKTAPPIAFGAEDIAYVLFTSGSSGRPKGVLGKHGSLSHFNPWMASRFELTENDRFAMLSGLAHAPLQRDLLMPIQIGASIWAPDPDILLEPEKLTAWMAAERITFAHMTPPFIQVLTLAAGKVALPDLRRVFIVGDALSPRDVDGLCRLAPNVMAVNYLGATEIQRATSFHITAENGARNPRDAGPVVPVGKGIPDVQLLVVSPEGALAGVGELGELVFRSPHLAAGYLHDPEGTRARFVEDFVGKGRAYRTGDLGRFQPNGTVDYVGRRDMQVKIRGFRVELGEIEAALVAIDGVKSAVVLAREDSPGDKRLVGYVVGKDIDMSQLKPTLTSKLPLYMVPTAFVQLDAMPLTPNRKLDRRALPAPPITEATVEYAPPRDELETKVAAVFRDVLKLPREIGIHENFFELGGHSLSATQLVARLRELANDLPLRTLFEAPSVAGLAERLRSIASEPRGDVPPQNPLVRVDRTKPLLTSFSQARFWFLASFEPDSPTYNLPLTMRVRGALDTAVLERSIAELVQRHEVFRTTFAEGGEVPLQVIHPTMPVHLEQRTADGSTLHEREGVTNAMVAEHFRRPFDLKNGPVLRALLVRIDEGDHVLAIVRHHIATDGWSRGIFLRELETIYGALKEGRPSPLAPLELQYADFAAWQRKELEGTALDREIDFWRTYLEGAPDALEIPTDRPRPTHKGSAGGRVPIALSPSMTKDLDALARRCGATPFMVLLSAYSALLSRWSRQDHVVVGSPVAGRTHPDVENIHGVFINSVPLHSSLEGKPTFRELVVRSRQAVLDAFAHQTLPFERLVEALNPPRDTSRTPLFQALFVFQNFDGRSFDDVALRLPGLDVTPMSTNEQVSEFDVSLTLFPAPEGYRGFLEYDSALYDNATMVRFTNHFVRLLSGALAEPDTQVERISILSAEEKARLLGEWNGTPAPADSPLPHHVFEAQAARTPNALAVRFGDTQLTYAELDAQANQLAHELVARGVKFDDVVAISLERSLVLPVAVLATLKAGAGYLPLDPKYPLDRRQFMAADGRPKVLLTQRSLPADGVDPKIVFLLDDDSDDKKSLARHPKTAPPFDGTADGLFYLIYTSGSTGKPKGVAMHHRPLANLLRFQLRESRCAPGDKTLQFTPLSFDVHFQEFFGTWGSGGTLVLLTEEQRMDPGEMLRIINAEGVKRIFLPYVALSALADTAIATRTIPKTLHEVVTAGEALVITPAIRALFDALGDCTLYNHYGPSETHVVTSYAMTPPTAAWPRLPSIGRAVDGVGVYIVDRERQLVAPGLIGEVYLGGFGPARGYFEREELTRERFVDDPFVPGGRMYKTGDLARHMPDGNIEFLGRADSQVKIRGYRIEVGEVESTLLTHPRLKEAVVVVKQDAQGSKLLAAYVATGDGATIATADLKAHLLLTLPDYMVPAAFVVLEKLPLTPSGKLDRRALPEVDFSAGAAEFVPPQDEVEEAVAMIFREVLGLPKIGIHDDFFALGGHSLKAARVVAQIRANLNVEIPVRVLFEGATVERLAKFVRQGGLEVGPQPPPLERSEVASGSVTSIVQDAILSWEKRRAPSSTWSYNMVLELRGEVDVARLTAAIRSLVEHQDALRATFDRHADGFAPRLLSTADIPIHVVDARELGDDALNQQLAANAVTPFAVEGDALVRFHVFERADHVLVSILWHQLVHDPTEGQLFTKLLLGHYAALSEGRSPEVVPPALPLRYVDYAVWERKWFDGEGAAIVEEARERIHAIEPAQVADRADGDIFETATVEETFILPPDAAQKLLDTFRAESVTPFMALTAVLSAIVGQRTNALDLGFIAPVNMRSSVSQEVATSVLGRFLNHVPIAISLRDVTTWRDLLARTRSAILDAYPLQTAPVARVLGHAVAFEHPFGRLAVNVTDGAKPPTIKMPRFEVTSRQQPTKPGARNDLTLAVNATPERFYCLVRGARGRVESATIHTVARSLESTLLAFDPSAPITTFG